MPSAVVPGAIASASAEAAGLRYVHDGQRGFHRQSTGKHLRVGKRWLPQFVFRDEHGRRLRDRTALQRIRGLVIPPAWRDVWVCADPRGHLQATGRDVRGRKQYRYHQLWRTERDGTKYGRMVEFARELPSLRRAVAADLGRAGLPRAKVLAAIVSLLETTFIRVGNEEYARSNHSFGLTTLKDRHVQIGSTRLRFHFRGKSGVFHQVDVHDPRLARIVRRCRELPGQELFQYLDDDQRPATVDSADVNAYIREHTGHDFTAKDFRTWAGTVLAAQALGAIVGLAGGPASATARRWRPTNRDVVHAIAEVAERLGNTIAVCRKSYVHPRVISAFLDRTLDADLGRIHRPANVSRAGLRAEERPCCGFSAAPARRSGKLNPVWPPSFVDRCGWSRPRRARSTRASRPRPKAGRRRFAGLRDTPSLWLHSTADVTDG